MASISVPVLLFGAEKVAVDRRRFAQHDATLKCFEAFLFAKHFLWSDLDANNFDPEKLVSRPSEALYDSTMSRYPTA
jgi:hypothetical protein